MIKDFILNALAELSQWSDRALWHSWLIHGVAAAPICLVFGPLAAVSFFLIRELEQGAHHLMWSGSLAEPYRDYFFDVFFPAVVAVGWSALSLPTLVG